MPTTIRHTIALGLLILAVMLFSVPARGQELVIPPEFELVPDYWVRQYWPAISEDARHLIIAYQLPEEDQPAFLHLYYLAWRDEYFHDLEFSKSISMDDTGEEAGRKRNDWAELAPVRPQALVWLIESLLPPGNYREAHSRYSELREYMVNRRWTDQERKVAADETLRLLNSTRDANKALKDKYTGNPVPRQHAIYEGPKTAAERQPATNDKPQNLRSIPAGLFARAVPEHAAPPAPLPGPCETADANWTMARLIAPIEDAWRQRADTIMAATNHPDAAGIWREIEARAAVYRKLHCEAYAKLEVLTSRAAFEAELAELDEPLWALLVELEMRLKAGSAS